MRVAIPAPTSMQLARPPPRVPEACIGDFRLGCNLLGMKHRFCQVCCTCQPSMYSPPTQRACCASPDSFVSGGSKTVSSVLIIARTRLAQRCSPPAVVQSREVTPPATEPMPEAPTPSWCIKVQHQLCVSSLCCLGSCLFNGRAGRALRTKECPARIPHQRCTCDATLLHQHP